MATLTKDCQQETQTARPGLPDVYYHLHSLLHTLRSLEGQQDQLCSLLADIQRSGKVGAATRRDLAAVLHKLPSAAFESELHALWSALEA